MPPPGSMRKYLPEDARGPRCAERLKIEADRAVAAQKARHAAAGEDTKLEEEGNRSSEEEALDKDSGEEVPRTEDQPSTAPGQVIRQPDRSFPVLIKQERYSPPAGQQLPFATVRPQQQQPASSPIRRRQPSRATKDIGLVRQSLTAAAEAPSRSPRRSQGRTPARTPARSQPASVPAQTITPILVPVIPAHALLLIQQQQQQQQQQTRQAVDNFETGRHRSGASNAPRAPPFSASRALSFAVAPPQDPAARASAVPAPDPAPRFSEPQEPVTPAPPTARQDKGTAPQAVEAAAAPAPVPEPGSAVPCVIPAPLSAAAGTSINANKEWRKATKLARKLKSLARESAYVREHTDRELKRLAKKSKRLEKKAKALAKRNEAGGNE
ncbi:hypothetical protein SMACR_09335 [Sordaria macrospora]|uniref:WGS project CABT00000000 data, contig 2.85 n=2 Tax=Sordaria macrospora TaxID=5147 RepID=F7WBU9_SORMK|nr:uncharacterized protein SMAC_09335 [Sordaria macrospora k-hell]KAA8624185.1 hypothetical protein SMACR_09335 [Sordaria macrospora]WPJ61305.1 hypothetical protein SMAC4_09335 [Sordaria macrospora]CCC14492.1 unnamed protein product [Sordaria macrospora k-hell]